MIVTKKPKRKKKRRNVAPASPRFLPSSQMEGEGTMKKKEQKDKKKKPKVKNPRGRARVTQGTRRALQRAVDISCRKPGSCP